MSRTRRVVAVAAVVLSLTAVTVAVQAHYAPAPPRVFTISGDVTGLYPGGHRPLKLLVKNDASSAIYVTDIWVESVKVNKKGCPSWSVWSPGYDGYLRVAKRGTATVSVPVYMRRSTPSACQGATYTIRYTGRGIQ